MIYTQANFFLIYYEASYIYKTTTTTTAFVLLHSILLNLTKLFYPILIELIETFYV
jgi:hypothetical protein